MRIGGQGAPVRLGLCARAVGFGLLLAYTAQLQYVRFTLPVHLIYSAVCGFGLFVQDTILVFVYLNDFVFFC